MIDAITLPDLLKSAPTTGYLSSLSMLTSDSAGNIKRAAMSFPVISVATTTPKQDLDTFVTPGWYFFYGNATNAPGSVNMAGQLMLVWSHTPGYVMQLVISGMWMDGSIGLYLRNIGKDMTQWRPWYRILGQEMS